MVLEDPHPSPLASLEPSFPRQPRDSYAPYYVPEPLATPCLDIDRPDDLPRFLLLGERDDASFELRDGGFVVEYVWPALNEGPVVRLWRRPDGGRKDMSCRVAMLRMERDGLLQLPPPLKGNGHRRPRLTPASDPQEPLKERPRSAQESGLSGATLGPY